MEDNEEVDQRAFEVFKQLIYGDAENVLKRMNSLTPDEFQGSLQTISELSNETGSIRMRGRMKSSTINTKVEGEQSVWESCVDIPSELSHRSQYYSECAQSHIF